MEITAQNAIYLGEETGGKGRQFKARFLVPGLVKYDYGVCLLTKENADKFIQGFTGCPVIINHQTVTDKNVKDIAVGDIFSVWFDEKDGYYWCNGILRDKEAIKLINEGYSVSCQYLITEYSDNTSGALHNGNPYDKVIENGKPEHLAIVNNPRYEGAIIAVNAIMAQNEDRWITIHPNGEENKGRHLLLKDGESVEDAMHRNGWYNKRQAKEEKKEDKNDRVAARHKHQEAIKKHQKVYEDFEKGIGTFEDIEKADKELQKANEEFYGKQSDTKDKQPDKEEKGEETKVYTEDTYDEFHKKFYKDYGDKWYINQLKDGFYVDKMKNGIGKSKTIKNNEIDEYLKDDVIRLRLNNKKKTSKDGNTNFVEDTKSLQKFLDSGYIVSDKYNDGYKMNYILQKAQSDKEETAEPKKYTYTLTKKEVSNDAWLGGMADTGNYYTNGSFAIDKRYLDIKGQEPKKVPDIDNNVKKILTETAKKKQKEENYTNVKDFEIGELKSEYGKPIKVAKYSYYDDKKGYTKNIYIDKKFNDLFKNFELKFGGPFSPVYAYDGKELIGSVMPIQGRDSSYTASNSFVSQFKDTLYTVLAEEIYNRLGE